MSEEFIDACVEVLLAVHGIPVVRLVWQRPEAELEWPEGENNLGGRGSAGPHADVNSSFSKLIDVLGPLCEPRGRCANQSDDGELSFPSGRGIYSRAKNRRLSSTNSFIKWQGDYGYGENLGLHCDQGANPLPWGHTALTANATWCLTDYTEEDGALAYVPGSHKSNAHPGPTARNQAVPAFAPRAL